MDEEDEIIVQINNELEKKIAEAFEVFDHAANKSIDIREVGTVVRSLGCCPTEAEIQEIMVAVEDPQKPGSVHLINFLPEMVQILTEHKYQPANPEELLDAFRVLDKENRGFLTKEYLSTLMTQDGEPFKQDELDEMLEIAIDPYTHTIPYEYYINQLMHEPTQENDMFALADKIIEESKPPRGVSRRLSDILREIKTKSKSIVGL